jgi:hypothetical protein
MHMQELKSMRAYSLMTICTIDITDFTITTTWGSNTNVKSTAVITIHNEDKTDSLPLWVFKICTAK